MIFCYTKKCFNMYITELNLIREHHYKQSYCLYFFILSFFMNSWNVNVVMKFILRCNNNWIRKHGEDRYARQGKLSLLWFLTTASVYGTPINKLKKCITFPICSFNYAQVRTEHKRNDSLNRSYWKLALNFNIRWVQ